MKISRRRRTVWIVLLVLIFALAAVTLLRLKSVYAGIAQSCAEEACLCFTEYLETGDPVAYRSGVSAFRSFASAFRRMTEDPARDCAGEIYGVLLNAPDRAGSRLPQLVGILQALSADVQAPTAHADLLALRNALTE